MSLSPTYAFTVPAGLRLSRRSNGLCPQKSPVPLKCYPVRSVPYAAVISHTRAALSPDASSSASSSSQINAPPTVDHERVESIRDQLEFWLSAPNLRRDWYLRRKMDDDGWLDPAILLQFNRLRRINASVEDVILAAQLSDMIEVSVPSSSSFGDIASQTRIRRSSSLPDFREWDDLEMQCSFILKSIPHDATIDSLTSIFEPIAPVSYIRIYRSKISGVAPRALICFPDLDSTNRVFETFAGNCPPAARGITLRRRHLSPGSDGFQVIAYNSSSAEGTFVVIAHVTGLPPGTAWKPLYEAFDDEILMRSDRHLRYMLFEEGSTECYLTISNAPAVRDMVSLLQKKGMEIVGTTVQVRLLEDEEELEAYWIKAKKYQGMKMKRRSEQLALANESSSDGKHSSGLVVKVSGLPYGLTWKDILSDVASLGKVVFLNHRKGSDKCFLRLSSPSEAIAFRDGLTAEEGVTVGGEKVHAYILEGEEEENYWERAALRRKTRRARMDDSTSEEESDSEE